MIGCKFFYENGSRIPSFNPAQVFVGTFLNGLINFFPEENCNKWPTCAMFLINNERPISAI